MRNTGNYREKWLGGEAVRAFVPHPLPPINPPLVIEGSLAALHQRAVGAIRQLEIASNLVPSPSWFLYGFARKEAVVSSQIEGTQATLDDVFAHEASQSSDRPDDVEEICNYVEALNYARAEIARPGGLPISTRLLCEAHRRLMQGARGADKLPGTIRTSQNWIGGTRPGNAKYVPPAPEELPQLLSDLDRWIHQPHELPALVRAGLAHVQFETIHPFLDGNGRVGRLLITLLVEHWGLLKSPLLYLSLAFKRRRTEYYARLSSVRTDGDWEGWMAYFLECVIEAAEDAIQSATRLFQLIHEDRQVLVEHPRALISAVRLFDRLLENPIVTLHRVVDLLGITKPTATKALVLLQEAGILTERTGKKRDRAYGYQRYLALLAEGTERIE